MILLRRILLVLAALATAIVAGFFYAYSVSVMPGLNAADPVSAINGMKAINAAVRTAEFAASFFGALALPVLCRAMAGVEPRAHGRFDRRLPRHARRRGG